MKEIQLTQGKVSFVDDEDYEYLNQFRWSAMKSRNGDTWYAKRNIKKGDPKNCFQIHKMLMFDGQNQLRVDHIDGNGLNNQRHNLRLCTVSQNGMNQHKQIGKHTSQYKGVHLFKRINKYQAQISTGGKRYHLGYFINEIDAAEAYDLKAKELFGEFARFNIV